MNLKELNCKTGKNKRSTHTRAHAHSHTHTKQRAAMGRNNSRSLRKKITRVKLQRKTLRTLSEHNLSNSVPQDV